MKKNMADSVYNFEILKDICAEIKKNNQKIVFTNGCFDIIHRGHVEYLKEAKKLGDFLVVAVNSDDSVKRLDKGSGRPVMNEEDRAAMIGALKPVNAAFIFDEDTPMEVIKQLNPDVLVKGADYKVEEIVGHEHVLSEGGKVVPIPLVQGRSTSELIGKIKMIKD